MKEKTKDRRYKADEKRAKGNTFIFPLRLPIVQPYADPLISRLCKSMSRSVRCPDSAAENNTVVVSFGGPRPHSGSSPVDDFTGELPPNLRVSFVLETLENEVISGGGVKKPCWAEWETHSFVATVERYSSTVTLPVPGPGEMWADYHGNLIYDALVHDGCGKTQFLPVEFNSTVGEKEDILDEYVQIGEFSAVDKSTLQPNGFWTFSYAVRATGTNGGVSDFKFRGTISITCTNRITLS